MCLFRKRRNNKNAPDLARVKISVKQKDGMTLPMWVTVDLNDPKTEDMLEILENQQLMTPEEVDRELVKRGLMTEEMAKKLREKNPLTIAKQKEE